jgi:putative nucleotidyltransferase with HDIG domain
MSTEPAKRLRLERLRLPTLPVVVQRVQALVSEGVAGTREIAEVVSTDAPLAVRVLKIANSAFYGLRERCISTSQACTVLGLRVLENVVLQAGVLQQYEHLRRHPGFDLGQLWRHSVLTAQVCSFIAKRSSAALTLKPEELYVCGLLHDIGQVILLDQLGDDYLDVVGAARLLNQPLHLIEARMLGTDHNRVGALVAGYWGLPTQIAEAIHYHHGPRERVEGDPVVSLVAHANLVVERATRGETDQARETLDPGTASFLGLTAQDVEDTVAFATGALPQVEI